MAKKGATVYVCQACGFESPKWMGQCICGACNTFVEERIPAADRHDDLRGIGRASAKHGGAGHMPAGTAI